MFAHLTRSLKQGALPLAAGAALLILFGLTGCAGPSPTATETNSPTAKKPSPAASATPVNQEEDAPTSPPEQQEITLSHTLGEVSLTEPAARVVALEWTYVEDLLAVGVQPLGAADIEGYQKWVNVEPTLSNEVTDVGTRQEPSLEAITALEPDLIIGVRFRHEPIYDDLTSIAPTLLFSPYPPEGGPDQFQEMEETFLTISRAVGREDSGKLVLDMMQAAFEEARSRLAESGLEGSEFVLAQAFTYNETPTIRIFTQNAMASAVMERIGLVNAWDVSYETYGFSTVDVEALSEVESAHFFYVVQEDDNIFADQLAENPVWQNLDFVQDDRTHALGGDTWLFGGPLSNQVLAEKVADLLTGME